MKLRNEMPTKRPKDPPMLAIKSKDLILGIPVIFRDEKSVKKKEIFKQSL